ncbi:hypothetical protein GQ457_12G015420 [Hibiscus cannabinus]
MNFLDKFVSNVVKNMKERFDNYWEVVRDNIDKVRETLYELYDKYVSLYHLPTMEQNDESGIEISSHVSTKKTLHLYLSTKQSCQ